MEILELAATGGESWSFSARPKPPPSSTAAGTQGRIVLLPRKG
jgi:hypothetical protein